MRIKYMTYPYFYPGLSPYSLLNPSYYLNYLIGSPPIYSAIQNGWNPYGWNPYGLLNPFLLN